jgi:hypothetical protein
MVTIQLVKTNYTKVKYSRSSPRLVVSFYSADDVYQDSWDYSFSDGQKMYDDIKDWVREGKMPAGSLTEIQDGLRK